MFWVQLIGAGVDGNQGIERIPDSFANLPAAMGYAEDLMENHTFPWGQATFFVITDVSDDVVARGAIHAGRT
ncbi:hypothetical protein [Mesorhizobium sp.]|uniref:hypothetical protein n=1 Tax=Mesorhizobium sp. TaxID=1871066 RepID=UPI00120D78DF|nr:hypothetical protein [Mesorhizobium sp.]TIN74623.1 MAG: hypothetical protein E5Y09_31930 [Mesorhizobium sp.]TIO65590.1 MAG: hypothetical protein E5X85_28075 [Mesorhizobium sp.]TJV85506.1 MAG: hypothetical protein E5X84_32220 [Mesorhizobium sp.]